VTLPSATPAPPDVGAGTVLTLQGISKRFGAVQALKNIELDVRAGEVLALVGDNGAGKSTLVKTIAGIHGADAGTIRFDGKEVKISRPQEATALGIATVYQDLALCDNLDVVGNLFLGRELLHRGVIDEVTMEKQARELLSTLSIRIPSVRIPIASLSGGQRQVVAIARALIGDPKVVILDEPTAALGVAQTAQVLELVRRLADNGLAVILISHNMNDVFAVSDRIAALYLGRMAAQVKASDVTHSQVVELITSGRSGELGLKNGNGVTA
jgi:D-xylose transport system ATP-binding protein